jgi:hypothetical protein
MKAQHLFVCGICAVMLAFAFVACKQSVTPGPTTTETLTGITAVYSSANPIFPGPNLHTLRDGLTVTANYNDGTTRTLTLEEYELSGTLAEGSSVITVTYQNKTTAFTVTVHAAHAHNWGAWIQTTAPTCTTLGEDTQTCSPTPTRNGTRAVAIDPTAHIWGDWIMTTTVSVTDDGIETAICRNDGTHHGSTRLYAYATGTSGLAFEPIPDANNPTAYRVRKGSVTGGEVHIPAMYRPATSSSFADYKPVTEIGSSSDSYTTGAFYNTAITTVSFTAGSQLTTIWGSAFYSCSSLISITTIPATVTSIGNDAFSESRNLTTVTFAEGIQIERINDGMFWNCSSLATFTFPTSVTAIGSSAFDSCTSLTSLTIPDSVTSIGNRAFFSCRISSLTIPAGVTVVGQYAFNNWTASQTIYIDGHANQSSADTAWGTGWRTYCSATIYYRE